MVATVSSSQLFQKVVHQELKRSLIVWKPLMGHRCLRGPIMTIQVYQFLHPPHQRGYSQGYLFLCS
jgi:hypothetical protein